MTTEEKKRTEAERIRIQTLLNKEYNLILSNIQKLEKEYQKNKDEKLLRKIETEKKRASFIQKAILKSIKKVSSKIKAEDTGAAFKSRLKKYLLPADKPFSSTGGAGGAAWSLDTGKDNSQERAWGEDFLSRIDFSFPTENLETPPTKSPKPSPPEKQFSPETVDLKLSLLSEKKADPEKDLGKDKTKWENKTKNEKASTVLGFLGASVADARAIADRFFGKDVPLDHLQKYNERLKASKQEREEKLREYLSSVENLNQSIKQYNAETQNNAQLALANRSLQQNATTKFTLSPQQEQEWWAKAGELAGQFLDNSGLEGNK